MEMQTTRRALLGGAGLAAAVAIVPAVAAISAPTSSATFRAALDASDAAARRFNTLPVNLETEDEVAYTRETEAMIAASRVADRATPTTWAEFVRLFDHQCDGGLSALDDDNAERLLAHAKRLVSKGA